MADSPLDPHAHQAEPDDEVLAQIALSRDEYRRACELLDRSPTDVELGMIGALWSEHCGYKHSRPLFHHFPTEGERILTTLGDENAGAIDIGDGWVAVMKIESHNHPSAIEPYEGAATGVGGIVRDIFAMGAQPIALLDSLRFGPLEDARNRRLCVGVVAGIGGYGNCLGIPTVGGEVVIAPEYSGNPLVNAMCLGVTRRDQLVSATAGPPGSQLMLVGADTGRDGLHGATFASVELDESSAERRPAVQVGNPFLEKLLMDACVGLVREHRDWIEGLQDCGAAGLTSSTVEMAERAGVGLILHTERVPRRERGMTPYEVMLSESQERMVVSVKPGHIADVAAWFEQWELDATVIGEVTSDGLARVMEGEAEVAAAPVQMLTNAPTYEPVAARDPAAAARAAFDPATLPDLDPAEANNALLELLASPNIASKRWVWRQYDHQVGTNTVVTPGSDAAVLRIRGLKQGLAVCTDGPGRAVELDPWAGAARAVCEAARNVACTGARPIAVTDCLNFGQSRAPAHLLPAARVDPRHGRCLSRLRCARRLRQRLALQRVRRRPGAAHARDRDARAARAPGAGGALRVPVGGRHRDPARRGPRAVRCLTRRERISRRATQPLRRPRRGRPRRRASPRRLPRRSRGSRPPPLGPRLQ